MTIRYHYLALVLLSILPLFSQGQDEGFIYGRVYTDDGHYEGPIRWGKEEAYWCDLFNAGKNDNAYIHYLSDDDRERLDEHDSWFSSFNPIPRWVNWHEGSRPRKYLHQFSCQFGEIESLRPTGSQRVILTMKNGMKYELEGEGYNDVGTSIRVADKTLGEIEVSWDRIERVEFSETPKNLDNKFGEPLWGTVEAYGQKFRGLIQWDKDERVTTDKLDGHGEDGSLSIEFEKIRSIEKKGNRSLVKLYSGRELLLGGSNDVDPGHRGVIVMNTDFPAIEIPWTEFKRVVFEQTPREDIPRYRDFKNQDELRAEVTTREGKTYDGRLVYDMDEALEFELLQGKEGDFEYTIPFRQIAEITPRGSQCTITMHDRSNITLDEGQDVSEKNQGLLIFTTEKTDPVYVPWEEVRVVRFR